MGMDFGGKVWKQGQDLKNRAAKRTLPLPPTPQVSPQLKVADSFEVLLGET